MGCHAKLLAYTQALGNADLLDVSQEKSAVGKLVSRPPVRLAGGGHGTKATADVRIHELSRLGVGAADSTFLGLSAIRRDAQAFSPPARTRLVVTSDSVIFEIALDVVARPAEKSTSRLRALPEWLVFVWLDDDEMPRIFAGAVIKAARANKDASLIRGETFEEARTSPQQVAALAKAYGHDRVVVFLDQNMDQYPEGTVLGTQLCQEIRALGFLGTLVISSANDELQDEREYALAGANVCIGKAVTGGVATFLAKLAEAHYWTCERLKRPKPPAQSGAAGAL